MLNNKITHKSRRERERERKREREKERKREREKERKREREKVDYRNVSSNVVPSLTVLATLYFPPIFAIIPATLPNDVGKPKYIINF